MFCTIPLYFYWKILSIFIMWLTVKRQAFYVFLLAKINNCGFHTRRPFQINIVHTKWRPSLADKIAKNLTKNMLIPQANPQRPQHLLFWFYYSCSWHACIVWPLHPKFNRFLEVETRIEWFKMSFTSSNRCKFICHLECNNFFQSLAGTVFESHFCDVSTFQTGLKVCSTLSSTKCLPLLNLIKGALLLLNRLLFDGERARAPSAVSKSKWFIHTRKSLRY